MTKTINKIKTPQTLKENKLLRWQNLVMLALILLAITLMYPMESQEKSSLNHPKAKSLMEEMASSAGH